jgi:hypothetical protein
MCATPEGAGARVATCAPDTDPTQHTRAGDVTQPEYTKRARLNAAAADSLELVFGLLGATVQNGPAHPQEHLMPFVCLLENLSVGPSSVALHVNQVPNAIRAICVWRDLQRSWFRLRQGSAPTSPLLCSRGRGHCGTAGPSRMRAWRKRTRRTRTLKTRARTRTKPRRVRPKTARTRRAPEQKHIDKST